MARPLRIDFPGARHHVMNRGARRAPVLGTPASRDLFVEVLAELPGRFGVVVHGYAVMPNHFHLLLGTPRGNLSRAMRHLGAVFTQRLNARHGWDGPVFRGRFHNRVVVEERYWRHLVAYVHLNPVPGLVPTPEAWPWSSHRAYAGLAPAPAWLHTGEILEQFGTRRMLLTYTEDQRTGRGEVPEGWSEEDLWTPVCSEVVVPHQPAPSEHTICAREALEEVAAITGTEVSVLVVRRMGRRDNRARWLAAWWLTRRAGLTQRQAGRHLNCTASGVAKMLGRLQEPSRDMELSAWMASLETAGSCGGPVPGSGMSEVLTPTTTSALSVTTSC